MITLVTGALITIRVTVKNKSTKGGVPVGASFTINVSASSSGSQFAVGQAEGYFGPNEEKVFSWNVVAPSAGGLGEVYAEVVVTGVGIIASVSEAITVVAPAPTNIPTVSEILAAPTLSTLESLRLLFESAYMTGQITYAKYIELYNAYSQRYYELIAPAPTVYTCPYCGATFSSQSALDSHIATYHPPTPPPTSGWDGVSIPTATQILSATSKDELTSMNNIFTNAYLTYVITYDYYMTLHNAYKTRWYQL